MDVNQLREFVARYLYDLREEAEDVAREADYQNSNPLRKANMMRYDAEMAERTLRNFVAWVEKQ